MTKGRPASGNPEAPAPIELRVVTTPADTKPESFAKKLINGGLIALLTGAATFATAMWTGRSHQLASECEIARDILTDDQLNAVLSEQQRRMIVVEAHRKLKACLND